MIKAVIKASCITFCIVSAIGCSSKSHQHHHAMDVSPEKMMETMIEASKPAPQHELLSPLVGFWKAESSWKMTADAPAQKSSATSNKNWVLNGLYVQEKYEDSSPEMPFSGLGMLGYDKVMDQFSSSWFDTMSSASWHSTGTSSENGKKISFYGGGSCPMTGTIKEVHSEIEIISNDKHVFRMFDHDKTGEQFKSFEIVYTRR